ncbi:Uncharacterised protein [Bordetella pertussis]|nr:Uncharacterised protein [Bordetella pertussis]
MRARKDASSIRLRSAPCRAAASSGGTSSPVSPLRNISLTPPTSTPTTGKPHAAASTKTVPDASLRVGSANMSLPASTLGTSSRKPSM